MNTRTAHPLAAIWAPAVGAAALCRARV